MLTDGIPSTSLCCYHFRVVLTNRDCLADDPQKIITAAVARMRAAEHHPNSVGVQIIQIGNDDGAVEALKNLMYGDVGVRIEFNLY